MDARWDGFWPKPTGLRRFLRVGLVVELDVVESVLMYAHRNDIHHDSDVLTLQLESTGIVFSVLL